MSVNDIYVPGRLTSAKPDKTIAGANEILDDDLHLKQNAINILTKKVVTLNSAPTSSTLTYTYNGVTCNFAVGDEVRVEDSSQGDAGTNNYIYYKLFDIDNNVAYWSLLKSSGEDSEFGYVPTLETVPTSSTTTYVKDGETIAFVIGQFARVVNENTYDFYQLKDLKNNGTEAVWGSIPSLEVPQYEAPLAKSNLVYNGNEQDLLDAGSTQDGQIKYSLDGDTWGTDIPKATNAGNHTVYWKLIGDIQHSNIPKTAIIVTIAKANGSVTTAPVGGEKEYTGGSVSLVTAGSGTGTMMYKLGSGEWSSSIPTATAIGSYTVYYKAAESSNYLESSVGSVITTIDNKHVGHEYVNLGLPSGTKWATMNIGANVLENYGNYYMYGKGNRTYNSSDSAYTGMEDPLNLSVDTVRQTWGGNWHTPTKAQFEELINNTTYSWTTINNIYGCKFTAANGKYIFFPASGTYYLGNMYEQGTSVYAWASSSPYDNTYAYRFFGNNYNGGFKNVSYMHRVYGCPVRGVIG